MGWVPTRKSQLGGGERMRIQIVMAQLKRERARIAERIAQLEEAMGSLRKLSGERRRRGGLERLSGPERLRLRLRNRMTNQINSTLRGASAATRAKMARAQRRRWRKWRTMQRVS